MNAMTETMRPLELIKHLIRELEKHEQQIIKALKYGGDSETFDQVCARVLSGELHLHALPNSVLLCEVTEYGHGKSYHVYIAAGDLVEILDFQRHELENKARQYGCNVLSFAGRLGWQTALKHEGWKPLRITMVKEVSHG